MQLNYLQKLFNKLDRLSSDFEAGVGFGDSFFGGLLGFFYYTQLIGCDLQDCRGLSRRKFVVS